MVRDNAEILQRLASEEAGLELENAAAERAAETREAFDAAAAALALSEAALRSLRPTRRSCRCPQPAGTCVARDDGTARPPCSDSLRPSTKSLGNCCADSRLGRSGGEEAFLPKRRRPRWKPQEARQSAEKAVVEARAVENAVRPPLQEARAELARIETEARTLAKILNAATGDLFPAVLEQISVERGFETALGAALGEDLDAALDRGAPVHWAESDLPAGDPVLPEGIRNLAAVVRAPRQLARRLAQVGIVDAADGARLQMLLSPGQRLVSREGAFWRWDGFTASADAPTAAAQRLAQKNRLVELDAEAVAATLRMRSAEAALSTAEHAVRERTAAEAATRQAWRDAQHALGEARDALARAERAAGELSSRRAALDEARSRIGAELAEAMTLSIGQKWIADSRPNMVICATASKRWPLRLRAIEPLLRMRAPFTTA